VKLEQSREWLTRITDLRQRHRLDLQRVGEEFKAAVEANSKRMGKLYVVANTAYSVVLELACVNALRTTCKTLLENHFFRITMRTALDIRSSVMHFIFAKALALTPTARQANSLGQMVNLMQLDTEKLLMCVVMFHQVWSGLMTILLIVISLYATLGPASLAGVAVIVLLIPMSMYLANKMRLCQRAVRARACEPERALEVAPGLPARPASSHPRPSRVRCPVARASRSRPSTRTSGSR
jgi:ABC-type multidrug transport system fused ATPase/permease subunit